MGGALWFFFWRKSHRRGLVRELDLKLFSISFPQRESEGREWQSEINLSEELFSALAALKRPFVFEVAVPHVGEAIQFYVAVPENFAEAMRRQLQGIWSEAAIEPAPDYNIFNYGGEVMGGYLSQKSFYALPIRTYEEMKVDTFSPILGGFTKINNLGEGAALQVVARPAGTMFKNKIQLVLKKMRKGESLVKALKNPLLITPGDIQKAAGFGADRKEEAPMLDEAAIKAVEKKLTKPLFSVNVRVLASAGSLFQAESIFDGIASGFSQFESPERNQLKVVRPKNPTELVRNFSYRHFMENQAMILNSEELASLFHFPTPFTNLPRVKMLKAKQAPPPTEFLETGTFVGESVYRGERRRIFMSDEDRRRHIYVVGQTGTGKSVLLNTIASQDIERGRGVCIIDPNGDLFEDVLGRIPKERERDVIVFDPGDLTRPLGINMLEYDPHYPEQKTFQINELMNIFNTLYDLKVTGGPMFEQYTRYALLLLMDDPTEGFTLLDVPRVLSDGAFRRRLLEKCANQLAKDFWEKEAEKAGGEAALANIVPYITSKFNQFIANDYMRPIVAQSKSSLNFREIMDAGKILLVNLSKGKIGELNAGLLGMIVVGKLTIAAFSRGDVSVDKRRDFYLFIDEFQNFVTPSIATILSESRKYRLSLTAAHQFIGQLKEEIRDAIFGNVGSIISFRVGADDADYLAKQFEPVFQAGDLVNIDNLNADVKLMINGKVMRPFNVFLPFPPRSERERGERIKELSRQKYGQNREEVELALYNRLKN